MSTSYVEFHVDDECLKNCEIDLCCWSKVSSLLAVSVYEAGGTVRLFNGNGIILDTASDSDLASSIPIKSTSRVTQFKWHPRYSVLAVSWDNGDLGAFAIKKNRSKWVYSISSEDILFNSKWIIHMEWIDSGEKLITINSSGLIIIWSFNSMTTQLTSTFNHQLIDRPNDLTCIKSKTRGSRILISCNSGVIFQCSVSNGSVSDVIQLESPARRMIHYSRKNRVIMVTENLFLCQFSISPSSLDEFSEVSKVKLSGYVKGTAPETVNIMMVDESIGLIAICTSGERVIRLWQLETGHNAALMVIDSVDSNWAGLSCFDCCENLLAAGTTNGLIVVWKRTSGLDFNKISQVSLKGNIKTISISRNNQIGCTTNSNQLYLVEEQSIITAFNSGIGLAQIGAKALKFFWISGDKCYELNFESPVKSAIISSDGVYVAVKSTGVKETLIYRTSNDPDLVKESTINLPSNWLVINGDVLWCLNDSNDDIITLNCCRVTNNFDESVTTKIDLTLFHDKPLIHSFDLNGNHLLITLNLEALYVYYVYELDDLSVTKSIGPKTINLSGNDKPESSFEEEKKLSEVKINSQGNYIAYIDQGDICIVHVESNTTSRAIYNVGDANRIIWSTNEGRMLTILNQEVLTIFICSGNAELTVKPYCEKSVEQGLRLIGFNVPYIFLMEPRSNGRLSKEVLEEFEDLTPETTRIMVDFLTTANLDLNSVIKNIGAREGNNIKIWSNLARIAVKCRDVKTGLYCMSKMKSVRVVRDVKICLDNHSDDNQALALLSMNLGLYKEAEDFLKQSGDSYALSKFYQSRNEWKKAVDCSDKLSFKTVCYNYAKYLEQEEGNIEEAIKYYELSGNHVFEVPRMLFDIEGNSLLENYCLGERSANCSQQDRVQLIRWWGQYCESLGDINQALSSYKQAGDNYNLVRLLCYTGQVEKAKSLMMTTQRDSSELKKEAALLHLGRHLEPTSPSESISYYLSAGAINHALRVCKANNLTNDLVKIIVNYGSKKDAVNFLDKLSTPGTSDVEETIDNQLLIQLYHKAESVDNAIKICINSGLWSELRELLSKEMAKLESNQESSCPISEATVNLALGTLKDNSEIIDIVVDLVLLAKDDKSLIQNLILDHNIEINEQLLEKVDRVIAKDGNNQLIQVLAETALQQGQYFVAAKLFNSIGDRIGSLKSLIRTGATDKIISYANIARDKNVFRIAANYLQTVNHPDDKIIATFYRKAGAKQELRRFLAREEPG